DCGSETEIRPIGGNDVCRRTRLADQVAALDQPGDCLADLIGREFLRKLTNNLPEALSRAYRDCERGVELAMKEELPVFGIEANDTIGQGIDRKVWRELEDIAVGKLRNRAAAISR